MDRGRKRVLACVVVWLAVAGVAVAQTPEDAAQAAAESWLRLVDAGDYAGSWDRASGVVKAAVKQADWSRTVGGARAPLGTLGSRKLKSRQHTDKAATRSIGGNLYTLAGDGKCVVIQYEAAFANKAAATEAVVAVADPDGAWRVAGYSVR